MILDYALERQNELIKMEFEKSQKENQDLKAKLKNGRRRLRRKRQHLSKDCRKLSLYTEKSNESDEL